MSQERFPGKQDHLLRMDRDGWTDDDDDDNDGSASAAAAAAVCHQAQ